MKHTHLFLILILTLGLLAGCTPAEAAPTEACLATEPQITEPSETAPATEPPSAIELLMQEMSLREKVGQLFIVRPDALDLALTQEQINDSKADGVTAVTEELTAALKQYPVGGVVMFAKNIASPEQITQFNRDLQSISRIPLFISVDEEGGLVSRLANSKAFDLPQYQSAASIQDAAQAFEMGSTIGGYLKEYGFNMDFAPVADVNTNPDNPVIGTRAFSSDPETAAQLASAMAEGLRQQEIIAVFKHFPGHGDTAEDSHTGIAISYKTAEEMRACEWLPFLEAESTDCVMVGHIAVPEITGDLTPASLSHPVVTGILREELGFQGLVVTDSLAMGAITGEYPPGEAALAALEAGCDLLLMPNGLAEAFDAVVAAVEDGTYSEAKLDETVSRILHFKLEHDLLSFG